MLIRWDFFLIGHTCHCFRGWVSELSESTLEHNAGVTWLGTGHKLRIDEGYVVSWVYKSNITKQDRAEPIDLFKHLISRFKVRKKRALQLLLIRQMALRRARCRPTRYTDCRLFSMTPRLPSNSL